MKFLNLKCKVLNLQVSKFEIQGFKCASIKF
jgi:hypothetical protein